MIVKFTPTVFVCEYFIYLRHAYAARVTVFVLCVCVCLSTFIQELQAVKRILSDTNGFSATRARKIM